MSYKTKELIEQRADIIKEMQRIVQESENETGKREVSPERREAFDKLERKEGELRESIEGLQRTEKLEALTQDKQERSTVPSYLDNKDKPLTKRQYDEASYAWICNQFKETEMRDKASKLKRTAERAGVDIDASRLAIKMRAQQPRSIAELRATNPQSSVTSNVGSEFVPTTLADQIEVFLLQYANILSVARVLRTPSGNTMTIPKVDDTANKSVLIAQNIADAVLTIPTDAVSMASYVLTSNLVLIPMEWARDSAYNVFQFVSDILGVRHARGVATYLTSGSGSSQPQGYQVGSGTAKTLASKTVVTFDELRQAYYAVPAAYRDSPKFAWVGGSSFLSACVGLVDDVGRPIFLPSMEGLGNGIGDRLFGKPFIVNDLQDAMGSNSKKVCTLGDWDQFLVRISGDVELATSKERYFEYRQTAMCMFGAIDSKVLQSTALLNILTPATGG